MTLLHTFLSFPRLHRYGIQGGRLDFDIVTTHLQGEYGCCIECRLIGGIYFRKLRQAHSIITSQRRCGTRLVGRGDWNTA